MDGKLYTFLMVAKTRNYTRAAENLNLTQPAVYKQIQYLENYYNVSLFKMEGKALKITDEGQIFLGYARQIINIHNELKSKLGQKNLFEKKYKIGATMTVGGYILPQIIYDYVLLNNNINVSLTVNNTNIILGKLLDREITMALIEGPFDKTKFKYKKFSDDRLVLLGPTKGELSKINSITINKLLEQKLILREKGSGTREIIEGALINKGYSHDILDNHLEISSINGIKTLVEEGAGLSILSERSIKKELGSGMIKIISIEDISLIREFNFVYLYDKDIEFIRSFMDFSLQMYI